MDAIGLRIVFKQDRMQELRKMARLGKIPMRDDGWNADYPDAENFMQLLYGPNTGGENNAQFDLPEYNRLFDQARALPDSRLDAQVTFLQSGYSRDKARLTVREGGKVLATQEVVFKASPKALYEALMEAKQHSAFSGGAPAEISRETGEKHESAVALANLGSLSMQQGDLTAAQQNYQESIKLRNEIGEKSGAAEVSLLLASLSIEEGNPSEGEALARKALEEFRAAKISESQISAHAILAQALLAQGKLNLAQKEIAMGKPLAAKTQQRVLRSQFEIAAAEVLAASGKPANLQAATASLKAVMQEAEKKGILGVLYEARLALGKAEMKHGNKEDGRARLAEVERDASASGFVLIRRKAATAL